MKVIGIMTLVVSVFAILSCGNESDNSEPETSSANITVPTHDPASVNKTDAITDTDVNKNAITPVTNVSSTALNPAHGVQGHRCDIAVGQPLNSKPAIQQPSTVINPLTTATTPSTKPTPIFPTPLNNPNVKPVTNPATILPTTPIAGLNPPHGQPGHRCDIKVGQPLNGTLTQPASPAITPTAATSTVAPGMNPAHGQPGHRCDIPIGKPLNSKPAKTP